MNKINFLRAIEIKKMPADLTEPLKALFLEAQGKWDEAHRVAQKMPHPDGAIVHAYLHRKEGNLSNASYWYSQIGIQPSTDSLKDEWIRLVDQFTKN